MMSAFPLLVLDEVRLALQVASNIKMPFAELDGRLRVLA